MNLNLKTTNEDFIVELTLEELDEFIAKLKKTQRV